MQASWTLQDAKNKFSEVVNAACSGTPQFVTKRGAAAVVVISVDSYSHLLKQGNNETTSFKNMLLSVPQGNEIVFDEPRGECELREVSF